MVPNIFIKLVGSLYEAQNNHANLITNMPARDSRSRRITLATVLFRVHDRPHFDRDLLFLYSYSLRCPHNRSSVSRLSTLAVIIISFYAHRHEKRSRLFAFETAFPSAEAETKGALDLSRCRDRAGVIIEARRSHDRPTDCPRTPTYRTLFRVPTIGSANN